MSKKQAQTSRKSRFEILENRLLLTTWNVAAKFNDNGFTNAASGNPHPTTDGGEAAFGDSATQTAAQLSQSTNNNYGDPLTASYHWSVGATDMSTSSSPWVFGVLDSGQVNTNNDVPYAFRTYVDPNSFDNYLIGSGNFAAGNAWDEDGPNAIGSYEGGNADSSVIGYNYGNSGLNGEGNGLPAYDAPDLHAATARVSTFDVVPTGTLIMYSTSGPSDSRFTAQSAGTYTVSATFTDPNFDPFDGPGGYPVPTGDKNAWTWGGAEEPGGQPDFAVFKVPFGSSDDDNTSTLLASGFHEDVASVNAGQTTTSVGSASNNLGIVGQTYTSANGGLTINSGNVLGSCLDANDSPDDVGLPVVTDTGTQSTTTYSYGSGGTWTLTNVGPSPTLGYAPPDQPQDPASDQYNMAWTVTETVSLGAGDSIDLVANPRYADSSSGGNLVDPTYVSAVVTNTSPLPVAAPSVAQSSHSGQNYDLDGPSVTVDSGVTVSSLDSDITGASMQITNYQSGDAFQFTPQNGITIESNSDGTLTLTGSATPAQYQTALQSVTFSTTSTTLGTRAINVIADDSGAFPTYSNTAVDSVNVVIGPPVVTANQTSVNDTAGQTVIVDSAVTVSSYDAFMTGAVVSISGNYQSGDTLSFTSPMGSDIYIYSNTGGVLTLSGGGTLAQYQAALQSVTFSSTSTSTLTRTVSFVVEDSNDTGSLNSNTATTTIIVSAPVTISQLYVNGTNWSNIDTYFAGHGYGSSTLGYALLTGGSQLTPLPWSTMNEIDVQFSGAVSGVGTSSFELVGGTGGAGHAAAAPSITSVTSLGGNAYQISLSSALGYNNYILAIASTGSSFGGAVTDANGAGISGTFTTSSSTFPSGNGLADSTFDFQFDVLPGDANQSGTVSSLDSAQISLLLNDKTTGATSASYVPFVDITANGTINANDSTVVSTNLNYKTSNITNPTAPSGGLFDGGISDFTALALGVLESGQTAASPASLVSNVNSPVAAPAVTTSVSTTSTASGGIGFSSATTSTASNHGRHAFAATDEAISDFDPTDLFG